MDTSVLVEDLRRGGREAARRMLALPLSSLDAGGYEGGWTGRQILAHISSIEWTYPRIIDLARTGSSAAGTATAGAFDIDAYNQRQVDRRADRTLEELVAEFTSNRDALVAAVETMDPALLEVQVESVARMTGSLDQVLRFVALTHVDDHLDQVAAGVAPA
ncbi:MAG: maleylpyruvate isomerase N-terminal domain-containing protein [Candidatus Dormibacteria bacterium]